MRYIFISATLLILSGLAFADTVITTDGRRISGKIIGETDEYVLVQTKFGDIKVQKSEIDRIERKDEPAEPPKSPEKPPQKPPEEQKGDPIERMIAKLCSEDEKESQNAKEALAALGSKALEPLKKALEKPKSDSAKARLEDVIATIEAKLKEQKEKANERYVNACKILKEWEASVKALQSKPSEEEFKKVYQKAYDAAKELEKACELAPDNTEWLRVLATLYYRLKNYKEALPKLKTLLQKEPDAIDLLGSAASCCVNLADYAQAEKYLLKILSKEPQNKVALLNLGIVYLQQQKYKKCAEAFEMAIAAGEDAAFVHYYLGVAYEQCDKKDKAVEEHKKAIEKDPKCELAYRSLGLLYAEMGKNAEAVENLEKYLQLKPDASDAKVLRKMIEDLKKSK
jgi:tetratricopeptide (TPR) repeat protein